ncbi:hypothetical protein [Exiguobacterium sp. 9-2]|uniref:hypothetical protein n=1 Tax=Exiguobacterium sp. 9-2 TaxID=3112419 RepID=UPI002E34CB0F|nr:hypothetical protein [Exiguobacterium sp. 9-2]
MKGLHTVPSFKEILMEKRRELLGTSLVVLIILMQVTTQLVNFLKKDEVHGLYTCVMQNRSADLCNEKITQFYTPFAKKETDFPVSINSF